MGKYLEKGAFQSPRLLTRVSEQQEKKKAQKPSTSVKEEYEDSMEREELTSLTSRKEIRNSKFE